jgi:hypothetical protein
MDHALDLLVGAVMWARDAPAHTLVLPAQTANSEDRVRTSRGIRVERFDTRLVLLEQRTEQLKDGFGLETAT